MSNTHFDWSPERVTLDDEGEAEDRYEADERVSRPPAAISRYVAQWEDDEDEDDERQEQEWDDVGEDDERQEWEWDDEGEDDERQEREWDDGGEDDERREQEWDDESETEIAAGLVGAVVTGPASSGFSDSPSGLDQPWPSSWLSAFWTTELDASDDGVAANGASASSVDPTSDDGAEGVVAVLPVRTTPGNPVASDQGAADTDLQGNHESLDGRNHSEPVTSQSLGPTGLVDLDATTAKPPANQAEAHRAENHRAIPDKMASLIDRGEERIQPGDTDKKSLAVGPRPAMDADDTLAVPARSRRDSPPVKENLPHRTLRHTEIPPGSRDRGPDRVFAALASASPDTAVGRLRDALSQDLAALEAALQDLLADRAELGRNLTDWFMGRDVFRWTVAATIALVAAEIVRRKAQRAHADAADPAGDSEDVSVRLFPELLGLPPRVRT